MPPEDEIETETPVATPPKAADGLQADLAKARAKLKEANARLAQFEGVDPQEYLALKEAQAQAADEQARKNGEFDKLLAAERAKSAQAEARMKEAAAKAAESVARAELSAAFAANGGKADQLDNFLILAKSKLVVGEDGNYTVPEMDGITDIKSYVAHLGSSDLSFAFAPVNQAAGSNKPGGKVPGSGQPRTVTPAEAPNYLAEIADGSVIVQG